MPETSRNGPFGASNTEPSHRQGRPVCKRSINMQVRPPENQIESGMRSTPKAYRNLPVGTFHTIENCPACAQRRRRTDTANIGHGSPFCVRSDMPLAPKAYRHYVRFPTTLIRFVQRALNAEGVQKREAHAGKCERGSGVRDALNAKGVQKLGLRPRSADRPRSGMRSTPKAYRHTGATGSLH